MVSLGPLFFAAPWALAALALLPVIWWLLRVTPPVPWRARFPPVRLLLELVTRQETSARTPPWLLILRLAIAALVIVGVAKPLFNPAVGPAGAGPLYIVIDDGWAAAANWAARGTMLDGLLDRAERGGRSVAIVTTAAAASAAPRPPIGIMGAGDARALVRGLQPKPWATDRRAALAGLAALVDAAGSSGARPGHVVWLSDGLEDGASAAMIETLGKLGALTVVSDPPARRALVLGPPEADAEGLSLTALRPASGAAATAWVRAVAEDGRLLAREALDFAAGERRASARMILPAELRNRLQRLEIEDQPTAAAVVLVDERWRRRPVGLASGEGGGDDQPLLGNFYYLERALEPFTEVRRGTIQDLTRRDLAVLVLADPGRLGAAEGDALDRWMRDGGVVLRFAGPRLARESDALLPVPLRQGDRTMGGTMSWDKPATLAPFDGDSPFHGLVLPGDIVVRRQVLAQPAPDLAEKTWARLSDGTPLVTAARRGDGWLILVHTSANTSWSSLALSGLFVDMLGRIVALSQGVAAPGGAALAPLELLDGFGRQTAPPASARAIAGDAFAATTAGPEHPPGYYGEVEARRALNLSRHMAEPVALGAPPAGVLSETYGKPAEVALGPWLLVAALVLAVVDLAASLWLRGFLPGFGAGRSRAALGIGVVVASAVLLAGAPAEAQKVDEFELAASLRTRLAYMLTGDREVDAISHAGLTGLGVIVKRRTAAELGAPLGVDPDVDELSFFPLLYWPLTAAQAPLSARGAARLGDYLRNGGTILFDTREGSSAAPMGTMRRIARDLGLPPLVPVAPDHVLRRSFYLLSEFPGRWTGGTVWVERAGERINDGVSPVIVGGHDWAAAWAMDEAQRPLFAVVPGGERQREMAYRFGINLLMYTLTGNYKADQVHAPAILERLGR